MSAPRLEIDLDKVQHNACTLVRLLADRGISVTGVTKATLGSPEFAAAMLRAGVSSIGDSRVDNIETMRRNRVSAPMVLIRSPMLSQAQRVVGLVDMSLNSELDVIKGLSAAAQTAGVTHEIMLMVELGDLREGIMPCDLAHTVRESLRLPNIALKGIGTNLACHHGVSPSDDNMAELSGLADSVDADCGIVLEVVSGGNSGNLGWALGGAKIGRINNLRLGESILLGRDPLDRGAIPGLHTDAITLIAEVIESNTKPSKPSGEIAQTAFGAVPTATDRGQVDQAILAVGRQDVDPAGVQDRGGLEILGASSDHLIVDARGAHLCVGAEVAFDLNYSALLRAMTSPFVAKVMTTDGEHLGRSVDTVPPTRR